MSQFIEVAKTHYQYNGCFIESEFKEDIRIISNISRMIIEMVGGRVTGMLRIRNLFICAGNSFGNENVSTLLEYKLPEYYWPIANSFLIILNMPCINTEYDVSVYEFLAQGIDINENI